MSAPNLLLDATVGRRLLVRIWFHGVLLFGGVIAMVFVARWTWSEIDQAMAVRHAPYLAASVVDRVLAHHNDPSALVTELRHVANETPLAISVFRPDGTHVASSGRRLAGATASELQASRRGGAAIAWSSGRAVVGSDRDGRLVAYAAVEVPSAPSVPLHVLALLGAALVFAFVFVAWPLTRSIARPLERLRSLACELGSGNLSVRANSSRRDELGDLARSFDAMAAQLQRLRAAERQLLGDVSHELRTPLARMRVVLDLASDADAERVRRYLGEITTDLAELEQLVDDIIASARLDAGADHWHEARPPLRRTAIAVDEPIAAALARFRARWPERVVELERAGEPARIDADPALVRRAVDNLLDNARAYSPDDAPIIVRVDTRDASAVQIEVIDRGIGIAPEDHPRVFSAFFRADRSRSRRSGGVGLGLVLARRIVEAHGGTIGFESHPDRGSRFWFSLASEPATRT